MKIFLLLACLMQVSIALNILALLPYEGKSHYLVYRVLMRELADRGHTITVVTPFKEDNLPPNYKEIHLTPKTAIESSISMESMSFIIYKTALFLGKSSIANCESLINNKEVENLIKERAKFDVILIEQFQNDCGLAVAHKLGAPVVGLTSNIIMPWHYERNGVPFNVATVPFHFTGYGSSPNYLQRLYITFLDLYFNTVYQLYVQQMNQKTVDKHLGAMPSLNELARKVKFMLTYTHYSLTGVRTLPSNFIEVGGYHVKETGKMPMDLKKFMDEAEYGVIYISFGSVADPSAMNTKLMESLKHVIGAFPHRFVWKYHNDTFTTDNKKLYLSSWLPQVDILAHPKTLAFISHCGMLSTTEAITFGVPMIAMPLFGDQPANSANVVESGLGVRVEFDLVSPAVLSDALKTVLRPEFNAHVKSLSKLYKDRPKSPMDTAIYWIEYASRNQNFTFTNPFTTKNYFILLNLDIILTIAVLAIGMIWVLIKFVYSFKKPVPVKQTKSKSKHKKH